MVMRFLICGIGSIGQRHYKNLRSLGHELALFREGGGANAEFIEKFMKEQEALGTPVKEYRDLGKAMQEFDPNAVFVTNPNSRHIELALKAAKAGKHLFIEKPLSNNLDGIKELEKVATEKNLKIMVGYNLRWHPLLIRMKAMVENGEIGQPLSAHIEMGENIEDWHPWEDYRETYAAYKEGGGGAVLCFSHDIDYLYWFFGKPDKYYSVGGKITPLGGDGEDMVKAILKYKNNFIVSIHLDYWQRPSKRTFEIIGTEGKIVWDYGLKMLTFYPREKDAIPIVSKVPGNFDRNDMFMNEIKDFISAIVGEKEISISFNEGIDVLEMSLEIKKPVGY